MSKNKKSNIAHHAHSVISADRIFYWAYGSNLSTRQMKQRCPKAIKFGPMTVQDCALVFRSVADVTVREGASTPGGLWQITADCERSLDQFEGVASKRYLKRYFRITIESKQYTCLFYQMRQKDGIMPPSESYLDKIATGYGDFGLDLLHLETYLAESWESKEPNEDIIDRQERNGWPRLARDIPSVLGAARREEQRRSAIRTESYE